MLGNLGMPEILLIMVIALLVFGAKRLPEIGSSLGKGIREFKRSMKEVTDDIDPTAPRRDLPRHDQPPAGPPNQG